MKLLIDLDGTVLDARARLHGLFRDLAVESSLGLDEYWEHKRAPRSHRWLLEKLHGYSAAKIERFEERWMELIEASPYIDLDKPFPGAAQALDILARKASLYLLTARQSEATVAGQLERHGLAGFFTDVVVTGQRRSKADAMLGLGLSLSPDDVLVGDTGEDIKTARALNIVAVALTGGFRCKKYLFGQQPDHIHSSILDFATRFFPDSAKSR